MTAEADEGRGNALVVRGEAGIGKTTLLDELASRCVGTRVLRVTGHEAEQDLPFAALHLLLRPARELIDGLPEPQRAALRAAFGQVRADGEDRFLLGLAVLTLLSDLAEDRPLLCLFDDAQWLDRASSDALAFVARRLDADRITMILTVREGREGVPGTTLGGLPELRLTGLARAGCEKLLATVAADLVPEVRDRVIEEAAGNPLALIEFAGMLTPPQRAGHLIPLPLPPTRLPVTGRLEQSLRAAVRRLPDDTRRLLLIAAAEGTGDLDLVLRAGGLFDSGLEDLAPAEHADLIQLTDGRLAFRHPLIGTAAYHEAPLAQRVAAHRAVARALDAATEPDRRAWQLSAAAVGPDEEVGDALATAGDRARRQGSHASSATAFERAAQLTIDRERRAEWLAAAAEAALGAGQLNRAGAVAERGHRLTEDPALLARLATVRAEVDAEHGRATPAAHTLIDAAGGILHSAPAKATTMLATAASAAWFAGDHAALRRAAELMSEVESKVDRSLATVIGAVHGMDRLVAGEATVGLGLLRGTIPRDRGAITDPVVGTYAVFAALMTGDDEAAHALAAARVETCRERGLVGALPHALQLLTQAQILRCRHAEAAAAGAEAWRIAQDTGQEGRLRHLHGVLARLAAIRGEDQECLRRAEAADGAAQERHGSGWGACALMLLDLVRARHEAVVERMTRVLAGPLGHTVIVTFAIADHVEACTRLGRPDLAAAAFPRFEAWAAASGQPWATAMTHRCRALLGPPDDAERHYAEALRHHAAGGREFEGARTRLLYGEWLRRARRRSEAGTQLRAALDHFDALGATPWAERARTELAATGTGVPARAEPADPLSTLTPQELQVVRLAATGSTNRQIAARLFLSPRTVGFHLYKAYPKLGISSRTELSTLALDPPSRPVEQAPSR